MKRKYFFAILTFAVLLAGCGENPPRYPRRPLFPVLPESWREILPEPHWRMEWLDEESVWREWEGAPGSAAPEISIPAEWATPVLAWPFWPERNLNAGAMRPAGAIFPWDSGGENLVLSWPGGVDALLWKEMSRTEWPSEAAAANRLPWLFDWPRFRELLKSESVAESLRGNLWLADWKEIGRKSARFGFDQRRIVPQEFIEVSVPEMEGLWVNSSPFAPPLSAGEDGRLLLNAADAVDTWVSAKGVLKCSTDGWVWMPRE